jgi:hypothetical protein
MGAKVRFVSGKSVLPKAHKVGSTCRALPVRTPPSSARSSVGARALPQLPCQCTFMWIVCVHSRALKIRVSVVRFRPRPPNA